jgi:ABC-type amino acid transport system permease subunit
MTGRPATSLVRSSDCPVNFNEEGKSAMNEGLIITLLIVNIALSAAALLGVFVALGMMSRSKEE